MRHVYECPVRWADLDLLGHVNNVAYVDFLQEARADLFRDHLGGLRAPDLGEGLVVVRTQVRYREPLLLRFRPVRVEVWVVEVRAASFTLAYEVFDEGRGCPQRSSYVVDRDGVLRWSVHNPSPSARNLDDLLEQLHAALV